MEVEGRDGTYSPSIQYYRESSKIFDWRSSSKVREKLFVRLDSTKLVKQGSSPRSSFDEGTNGNSLEIFNPTSYSLLASHPMKSKAKRRGAPTRFSPSNSNQLPFVRVCQPRIVFNFDRTFRPMWDVRCQEIPALTLLSCLITNYRFCEIIDKNIHEFLEKIEYEGPHWNDTRSF